jgi:large subunit ribosomal protein L3
MGRALTASAQLDNCQVTANITTVRKDASEYHAVQLAATDKAPKNTPKQMKGHFKKAAVAPKQVIKEFRVTPDAHVPVGACQRQTCPRAARLTNEYVGTTLSALHFVPGQYVDVIARS